MITTILCTIYLVGVILLANTFREKDFEYGYAGDAPYCFIFVIAWPIILLYVIIGVMIVGCYLIMEWLYYKLFGKKIN